MLESDLVTYLSADAAITAVVGTRIYPTLLPQTPTYPLIRYQRIETEPRDHALNEGFTGLYTAHIRIEAWALDYLDACTLAELILARLESFRGKMGHPNNSPPTYTLVNNVIAYGPRDAYADILPTPYIRQMEFQIQVRQ